MFSAMTGFFVNPVTGASGRITYLTGTSPYNNLSPFPSSESSPERLNYSTTGNWVVTANSGTTARPGATIYVNKNGTIINQVAYNTTNGPLIGGAALVDVGDILNDVQVWGWGQQIVSSTKSTNYLAFSVVTNTQSSASTTNGSTITPVPGQASIDRVNNRINYVSNSDSISGSTALRIYQGPFNTVGPTTGVPTIYRQLSSASGTFTTFNYTISTGGRTVIVGSGSFTGLKTYIITASAGVLSSSTTFTCGILYNTTGTINTTAVHVCTDGTFNYITGRTYSSVSSTTYTTFIAKYAIGSTAPSWAKIMTTTAGSIRQGMVVGYSSTTGYVYTLGYNQADTIYLTAINPATPTIVYSRVLKITTTNGRIIPTSIMTDSTNIYIGTNFYLSTSSSTSYPASFQFPIDGSIPGSGTYTVGSFTFTYTAGTESFLADAMTSSSISITNGTGTTIVASAVTAPFATITNMSPTTITT